MSRQQRMSTASAVLWASAFVILAMIIVRAGDWQGNAAWAEMASGHDSYEILTTDAGRGGGPPADEVLYVLDRRDEVLLIYDLEDARRGNVILRSGGRLTNVFEQARR